MASQAKEAKTNASAGAGANPSPVKGYALIAVIYLLGLFMGALDTGIVTPARTVIQNGLGVDDQLGVWLVTIYTLAYAASIPLMGKLADRHGRKYIYILCVFLFGLGSLGCGLAQDVDSFTFLLFSRAVQAIGGGGIMPIATAEFGTAFPPEKRGMALGLVGGVYGIANVFGASAGSLILDIFGQSNWQFIFYINIPICLFIVLAGLAKLPNKKKDDIKPIDGFGTVVLVVMVLSLLYGLRNLDFFDFATSIGTADVYPFFIAFLVLLPVFIFIEKRASDPILNLSYFTNRNIIITMLLSIVTGVIMMGMIFVPQFAENALMLPSGKGGYWVILLGLFAGIGAPVSGKLIDRFGVKAVMGSGLVSSLAGALFLAFVASENPSVVTVAVSFVLIGLGLGFIMGTPINYMMLENTKDSEANSALATLSLMRSMGTAVAPAIMVAFLAHSGALVQDRVMDVLPNQVAISALPHQKEVSDELKSLSEDPETKDKMKDVELPDFDSFTTIDIDMNDDSGKYEVPDDIVELLKTSDVTTIVDNTKTMASTMFAQIEPDQEKEITDGIDEGTGHMKSARDDLNKSIKKMQKALDKMPSPSEMTKAATASSGAGSSSGAPAGMSAAMMGGSTSSAMGGMPAAAMSGASGGSASASTMPSEKEMKKAQKKIDDMKSGLKEMKSARDELDTTIDQLDEMKKAIPDAFNEAEQNYLKAIDGKADDIQRVFQSTLNEGFSGMFSLVSICTCVGLVLLALYRSITHQGNKKSEASE